MIKSICRRSPRCCSGYRMRVSGLRTKCQFLSEEVMFLGHKVDAKGLHPVHEKVRAIQEAPTPSNVTELKAYLRLLNYYHTFLPNLSRALLLMQ